MRKSYRCLKVPPFPLTGRLDREPWTSLPWTDDFVDILGEAGPLPRHRTRAKMAWTDEGFVVGAELEDPHVWATLTEHDSVIFQDNDFEVFIDPDGDRQNYLELEVNALNTTWDLFLPRTYWDGGPAINSLEIKGLQTQVSVQGTLNDPSDTDQGWSVEILIPWPTLIEISSRPGPPRKGDQWRVNFSRVQWQHEIHNGATIKKAGEPEDNWVWSPQGVVDMHRPEKWGVVEFCESWDDPPPPPIEFEEIDLLMEVYWAQKLAGGDTPATLESLDLGHLASQVTLQLTGCSFSAETERWRILCSGRLMRK